MVPNCMRLHKERNVCEIGVLWATAKKAVAVAGLAAR